MRGSGTTSERLALAIALGCAIGSAAAPAGARSVAFVLVPHRPHAGPEEVRRARTAAVRAARMTGWDVPAEDALGAADASAGGTVGAETLGFSSEVRGLLAEAEDALRAVDLARARERLADAETLLRGHLSLPLVVSWLVETGIRRAVVEWHAGDVAAARAALDRALSMAPARRLTPAEVHPGLVDLVEEVRRERAGRPRVAVTIDTIAAERAGPGESEGTVDGTPPRAVDARVFVDDEEVGRAPVTVELVPGRHVVRAEERRRGVATSEIEIGPQGAPRVELVLGESEWTRSLRGLPARLLRPGQPVTEDLRALASAIGVDVLVVGIVTVHRGRLGMVLQAVGERGAGERTAVALDGADEMLPAILAIDPGRRAVSLASHAWIAAPDPEPPGPARTRAWYERWYVWAAIGFGAVGGAAFGYAALKPEPERIFLGDTGAENGAP